MNLHRRVGDETTPSTYWSSQSGSRDEVHEELDRDELAPEQHDERVSFQAFSDSLGSMDVNLFDIS